MQHSADPASNPCGQVAHHDFRSALRSRFASVGAILALTAALGAFRLGEKGLWHDEAFAVAMGSLDLSTIFRIATKADSFDSLYFCLMHFWMRWGSSESWIRIPSFLFGLCAVFTLFVFNKRLFGLATAVISAVLLAINPFFVQYEQEARPYTLTVFLVVVATYTFVLAVERRSSLRWIAYGAASALAMYARIFSGFAIAAHALSLVIRHPRPRLRDVGLGFGLSVALVSPLLLAMLASERRRISFVPELELGTFTWLFLHLTGGSDTGGWSARPLLLWYFAVCCCALFFILRATKPLERRRDETWPHWLVLFWLLVPILGSAVVSLLAWPIIYPRYQIFVLPALVTLAGLGIAHFPHKAVRAAALLGLIGLSLPALVRHYSASIKEGEDWRGAVRYVVAEKRQGDGVVFLSRYGRRPFEYYLNRSPAHEGIVPLYPGVAWGGFTPVLADLTTEPTSIAAERLGKFQRVWVILLWGGFENHHQDGAPIRQALELNFEEIASQQFDYRLQVRLYQRVR